MNHGCFHLWENQEGKIVIDVGKKKTAEFLIDFWKWSMG